MNPEYSEVFFLKSVEIFTDGACRGNPGPGGWGAILRYKGYEKSISGGEPETTNNRMELRAVIEAIRLLKEPCEITLLSDSKYVCDALDKGWVYSWQKKSWKKSDGKPALNSEMWEELLSLIRVHTLKIEWIKGHAGHTENEAWDRMATAEADRFANMEEI